MVQKMLDASTVHIKSSTAQWLETHPIIMYDKGEYGWFIYTQSEELPADTPDDLIDVINYANSLGCSWLMLDRDGDIIDELGYFEW